MKKAHLLSIDNDVWCEAKAQGMNISAFLEAQLKRHLKITEPLANKKPMYMEKIDKLSDIGRQGYIGSLGLSQIKKDTGEDLVTLLKYCEEQGIQIID